MHGPQLSYESSSEVHTHSEQEVPLIYCHSWNFKCISYKRVSVNTRQQLLECQLELDYVTPSLLKYALDLDVQDVVVGHEDDIGMGLELPGQIVGTHSVMSVMSCVKRPARDL